jgi:type II secretory pathway pseudopilin PulG/Zn finger protein HypA/HybF involved in hydrogenase expression
MTKSRVVAPDGDEMGERTSWLAKRLGRADRSERGDTMVEILLSLIVLGLTSVALLIGFSTTISASATHRQLAAANLAINNYSQQVTAGVEADSTLFTCPGTAYTPASFMAELGITSTAPYSPHITSIQYWNPTTESFGTTCVANSSELITVAVSSGSKNQTLSFVVDSPTAGSNFVGGAPTNMAFVNPVVGSTMTATSGASLPTNPVVEVYYGNSPDATDLSPIALTLGDASGNPTTAGTLSGCSSNDLNGVVTYSGCTISLTTSSAQAVQFTLVANSPSFSNVLSGVISVSGSTSSYLAFTTQPAAGYSGAIMSTQPVINAYQGGTTTVDTTVMSITLTTSGSIPGTPQLTNCSGTSGYSTTSESNGVVTVTDSSGHGGTFNVSGCDFSGQFFYDTNSGAVGTPYTMTASAPNVTSATSQPFAATGYGSAAQMEFVSEPSGGSATTTSATTAPLNSFQIAIEDSWGNILSGQGQSPYAGSISVKLTSSSTSLGCTTTSLGGIFTFTGCSAAIGSNLTLTATATGTGSTGVTPEVSTAFNDTGPVSQLVWYNGYPQSTSTGQPVAGASGAVMTNQPVLAYEDAGANPGEGGVPLVVTSDTTSVSYTSTYSSGTQGNPVNGTLTTCSNLPPINGIISAGNCTFVGLVGTNYTMKATTTSGAVITSPASATFSPTGPGPASQLVFTPTPGVEPVAAAAGSPFSTEPVVVIEDAGGNIVTSATTQVEMNSYLTSNTSVQGGSLLNCSTQAPVNGSVSLIPVSGYLDVESSCAFGGIVGTNYELIASATGLSSAVSTSFTPTTFGPASAIVVSGCAPSVNWANSCTLSAAVQDAWGNLVTSYSGGVTFADVGGVGTVSGLGTFTPTGGVANDVVTGTYVGPELITAASGSVTSPQYSFTIVGDSTVATVSELPSSVVYGHEATSVFTVSVVTGNHEQLPTTDNVTVNVGSASCIAAVAPSGNGGTGTCSIANTALPVSASPYTVTATYPGDAQLQASGLATAPTGLTVTKDTTTATVSETPTSVVYGHEASSVFTVNVVTGNHEVLPSTDNVTVNVGSASCVAAVAPSGNGGTGTCSLSATALPVGGTPYAVTATYPGDTSLSASSLATAPTGLTVTKDTTSVVVSDSPSTVNYGNEASSVFTVDVNPANGENLPGVENVTVNVGPASCVAAVAVNTIGSCSISATALAASATPYTITATYPGDADLSASAMATAVTGLTVNKDASTMTVSESPTSVVYGAEATSVFTVNVNPTYGENLPAVENVTVNVGSASCVAAVAVTTIGTCSIANAALPASGTPYTVTASYPGDADITASTMATAPTGLTVTQATPPTITWATPSAITYGTLLSGTQLNATDSLPGTFVYSPASGTLLTAGSQTLGVTFTPTDTTDYSTATKSVTLTVNRDTTTATVSETPTSVVYGNEASTVFTVHVNPTNGENLPAAENVTVNVGSASCVAVVAVTKVGTCSITNSALAVNASAYAVTATYPGDVDLSASATATAATGLTVTKDTSSVVISESPTSVSYGNEGASVFEVDVNPANGENLPAVENVTVHVGTASCVAAVAVTTVGTCSISATALAASATPYTVTATYPGDTDISASALATAATGLTVNKDTTSVVVSASPTSVTYNAEATSVFTVDVNPANGENLPAIENVTVHVGTASCVAAVATSTIGTCSIANAALTANATPYVITATYGGDTDLSASALATAATGLTVNRATPPTPTWATPAAITYGKALSGTQLNASDTLAGSFVYSPVSGTVLPVGTNQSLTATFNPTDSTDYTTAFASTTITVNQDSSTTTVSETPTSVAFGSEASSVFTVHVVTANGENLPAVENVTVNVGSASCVAAVAITKVGTCSIGATALPASGTAYTVTAAYPGDVDISASATATAATGLTVTKITPTVTVTNTTDTSTGALGLTATVLGTGTTGPTGTISWNVTINGTAYTTCSTALTVGSGSSTATCTISNPAMGTYLAKATYVPGSDPDYNTATTANYLGMFVGTDSTSPMPTTADYYTINASSAGSTSLGSTPLKYTSAITITGITGFIVPGFTSGTTPSATFTLGTGQGTYAATAFTCSVTTTAPGTTCNFNGTLALAANTYLDLKAQRLATSDSFVGYWIVTFTQ